MIALTRWSVSMNSKEKKDAMKKELWYSYHQYQTYKCVYNNKKSGYHARVVSTQSWKMGFVLIITIEKEYPSSFNESQKPKNESVHLLFFWDYFQAPILLLFHPK